MDALSKLLIDKNPIMVILGLTLIMGGGYVFFWKLFFGARKGRTKKTQKLAKNKVKEKLAISDIQQSQLRYKALSDIFNTCTFGRLTPMKKDKYNALLASVKDKDAVVKTAEELHCQQWFVLIIYIIILVFLTFAWSYACSLGLFLMPLVFAAPVFLVKTQVWDEEYELDTEFRNFFNIYYVQYKRIGNSVNLLDVVKSYMTVAPAGMQLFCNRFMTDLSSGEAYALRNLDRRYSKNGDVHRFCAIAQLVSSGDANSEKVVDSFREALNRKKLMRQRKELQKNKASVEFWTTGILYAVCMTMMAVVFVFLATT